MGTVIQLKNQINNSYFQLKDSVENRLLLVEEKIKVKLFDIRNYKKLSKTNEKKLLTFINNTIKTIEEVLRIRLESLFLFLVFYFFLILSKHF